MPGFLDQRSRVVLGLATPLGLLAAFGLPLAVRAPVLYDTLLLAQPQLAPAFLGAAVAGLVNVLALFSGACAVFLLIGFFSAFTRQSWALGLVRKCCLAVVAWVTVYAYVVAEITGLIRDQELLVDDLKADAVRVFYWRWDLLWPAGVALLLVAGVYLFAWRRVAIKVFRPGADEQPAKGDLVVENLRTHGPDPRYRLSLWHSFGWHLLVIVLLPLLLQLGGCVEPYRVPKGSGNPVVALVKIVQPKKEKKKKILVNPNSAISFYIPDLDDSDVVKKVEEMTQVTYQADPNRVMGAMGAGGGKKGGWPDGMENALVRFIRLDYGGEGWDDGMDTLTRADLNFLDEFHRLTGFKVARKTESHPIRLLSKYPKGFAPPFVYMTGRAGINVPAGDLKVLREYLLDGGMLFADCGSPQWHSNFRGFVSALLPGEPFVVIADDDPIFQMPYTFRNGAPPLWHHGGTRALGVKYKGRWVVFYHPGDVHDAWKTGHSGISTQLAKGGFEMGVNVVYYAFTHYLELTRKYRK